MCHILSPLDVRLRVVTPDVLKMSDVVELRQRQFGADLGEAMGR